MSSTPVTDGEVDHDTPPPANRGLLAIAAVLLVIPIVALMWVSSYARVEPKLGPWPFFFWYQFLWVFLTAACTFTSYRLVRKARPHRPMTTDQQPSEARHAADDEGDVR